MIIKTLIVKSLYGYIDKDIEFYNDFNLLVGINGSGKTSILNIISWLIQPSLPNLCTLEFKEIKLTLEFNEKSYTISCKLNKKKLKYFLTSSTNEVYNPLIVNITHPSKILIDDEDSKTRALSEYYHLQPDLKEAKTWELLKSIPDPTIVGLDRNLFSEESETLYYENSYRNSRENRVKKKVLSPLDRVKELVNTEYRKRKNEILNLTSRLKNHLMLSAFEGSLTLESVSKGIRYKINLNQIELAESRVTNYFKNLEKITLSDTEQTVVTKYFSNLKDITRKYLENPNDKEISFLFGLNANQFIKINKLLKEFERFETDSTKTLKKINSFLETLNHFFKDSSKLVKFKEDTSEITYDTLDKKRNILTPFNDIKYLSSGERQILILFSYLAFNSEDGKLFIIDEPELSLHIKWQEDFLTYLAKLAPPNTQIIIATHSPILVANKRENTILLLPYNN